MHVIVVGGAGYVGTHTCVALMAAGHSVTVLDNLSNSSELALERVKQITGKDLKFYRVDLLDSLMVDKIFSENDFDAVMHFAGLKAVGESVRQPLKYYRNNVVATLNLCEVMAKYVVKKIIFSSSATVYGNPKTVPITEDFPFCPVNPYGQTKVDIEQILKDIYRSDNSWSIVSLRYFNPIGAHESGLIGEDPTGVPNNLMPYISQVAVGELAFVNIFGGDYNTKDGTGVRDYIHVMDLANGHLKALEKIKDASGLFTYNLGTGKGCTVLELISAFSKACGTQIKYKITDRRPGDIDLCYAETSKARKELNFEAKYDIFDMCRDAWNWQVKNKNGYNEF